MTWEQWNDENWDHASQEESPVFAEDSASEYSYAPVDREIEDMFDALVDNRLGACDDITLLQEEGAVNATYTYDPLRGYLSALEACDAREERIKAELRLSELEQAVWSVRNRVTVHRKDEVTGEELSEEVHLLDESLARNERKRKEIEKCRDAYLALSDGLRREAARIDPSAQHIWHGEILSVGSS